MNLDYNLILDKYEEFSWKYDNIIPGFMINSLGNQFAKAQFENLLHKHWLVNKGRKRKFNYVKWAEQNPEAFEEIRKLVVKRFTAWYKAKCKQTHLLNNLLWDLSGTYTEELSDDWINVHESNTSTYNSQGYGKYKYARGVLITYEIALEDEGIPFYVHEEKTEYGAVYTLFAKCTKGMLDALIRRGGVALSEKVETAHINKGLNSRVYWPMKEYKD